MKKLYYVIPLIVYPFTVELCELLYEVGIGGTDVPICVIAFFLISVMIGNLTPTSRMFDYALPIVCATEYNCYRFICGFFAKDDLERRFSIFEAFDWVFYDMSLLVCAIIAVTTFLASFKLIRITRIIKKH